MEAVDEQRWQTQIEARPAAVPHLRREVLDTLSRECPGVDLAAAGLIVTELAANVVNHAYTETGPVEVEVLCEPDAATLTVRDWGHGFGKSPNHGLGIGLQIATALASQLHVRRSRPTEIHVRLVRAPYPGRPTHA
ncbi:MAG TPA: ATP-binding protein [Gaiellales bacterium]|nr:ATP-binding protein [Gaiellales bacterium]